VERSPSPENAKRRKLYGKACIRLHGDIALQHLHWFRKGANKTLQHCPPSAGSCFVSAQFADWPPPGGIIVSGKAHCVMDTRSQARLFSELASDP
jgi:hypothetical protein